MLGTPDDDDERWRSIMTLLVTLGQRRDKEMQAGMTASRKAAHLLETRGQRKLLYGHECCARVNVVVSQDRDRCRAETAQHQQRRRRGLVLLRRLHYHESSVRQLGPSQSETLHRGCCRQGCERLLQSPASIRPATVLFG